MPAAYSYDLRERVVDAVERGSSRRRAAVVFKVSAATVVRWTKRLAETGSFAAAPTGGDFKSKAVEAHKDCIHPVSDAAEVLRRQRRPRRVSLASSMGGARAGAGQDDRRCARSHQRARRGDRRR
jgi:transposase